MGQPSACLTPSLRPAGLRCALPLAGVSHGKRWSGGRCGAPPRAPRWPRGRDVGPEMRPASAARKRGAIPGASRVHFVAAKAAPLTRPPRPTTNSQQPAARTAINSQAVACEGRWFVACFRPGYGVPIGFRPMSSPAGPAPTGLMPCPPDRAPRHAPLAPPVACTGRECGFPGRGFA